MRTTITLLLAIGMISIAPVAAQVVENFDSTSTGSLPTFWTNGGVEPWTVHTGTTGSSGTGPAGDHTSGTGNYAYCECSGAAGAFILNVPPVDTTGFPTPTVDFWYHMFGLDCGTLELQESIGGVWTTLWTVSGDQTDMWFQATIPITGGTNALLRFHYDLYLGFAADACLDDITLPGVFPPPPFQGNAPGASLDISGIQTSLFAPAVTTVNIDVDGGGTAFVQASGSVTLSTDVANAWWEIVQNTFPLIAPPSAVTLPAGIVNLDVVSGFAGLNGGTSALAFVPFPAWPGQTGGSFTIPWTTGTPLMLSSQAVVTDPSAPGGFQLSQGATLDVVANTVVPATINPTTPIPGVSDDGLVQVPLLGTFTFYGVSYTSINLASNGIASFGAAISTFSNSIATMESGGASVSPCWDDLSPQNLNGMMGVYDDGINFEATWHRVPRFAGSGESTFGITLNYATGAIEIRHGLIAPSGTMSATCGICPGNGLSIGAPAVDLNVPLGVPTVGALDSLIENFDGINLFDLGIAPAQTTANLISFVPTGGVGTGPYLHL